MESYARGSVYVGRTGAVRAGTVTDRGSVVTSTRALLQDWEWFGWLAEACPQDAALKAECERWHNSLSRWEQWRLSRAVKRHNRRQWRELVDRAKKANATRPTTEEQ